MTDDQLSRRHFNRFTAAAFAGAAAAAAGARVAFAADPKPEESELLKEPHVCRGLNVCKNTGGTKENACAGQGMCATAAKHECKTHNECKGQGGCGEHPGENKCKAMGDCTVPLKEKTWKTARTNFEAAMKKAGKKFGDAPKPKKA